MSDLTIFFGGIILVLIVGIVFVFYGEKSKQEFIANNHCKKIYTRYVGRNNIHYIGGYRCDGDVIFEMP